MPSAPFSPFKPVIRMGVLHVPKVFVLALSIACDIYTNLPLVGVGGFKLHTLCPINDVGSVNVGVLGVLLSAV